MTKMKKLFFSNSCAILSAFSNVCIKSFFWNILARSAHSSLISIEFNILRISIKIFVIVVCDITLSEQFIFISFFSVVIWFAWNMFNNAREVPSSFCWKFDDKKCFDVIFAVNNVLNEALNWYGVGLLFLCSMSLTWLKKVF